MDSFVYHLFDINKGEGGRIQLKHTFAHCSLDFVRKLS